MLMFVFGAGASFDSDPSRQPRYEGMSGADSTYRPPLAAGLFNPESARGREVVAAHPRAAALIMQLRQATAEGLDIEEVLEQRARDESYPNSAAQLLAFRAYLADLMTTVPNEWVSGCQGLTNYVLALEKAARWNAAIHRDEPQATAFVTFNYDTMLEDAVHSVFGHRIDDMDKYTTSPAVRIYKPHGSVNWRVPATWDLVDTQWLEGRQGLAHAIDMAAELQWDTNDKWAFITDDRYQDRDDRTSVWLPALSIPVRNKSVFTMPDMHKSALVEDMQKVTTLIAVGWRARENHFLKLLEQHMPSSRARLVAVSNTDEAAQETIENLWETGRFGSYAKSGLGFSGFTESPTRPFERPRKAVECTPLTLDHVLAGGQQFGVWTNREPGRGLPQTTDESPYFDPGYNDL